MNLRCFHGTSTGALAAATASGGLTRPYLAASLKLAGYYAAQTADADGSGPVVVEVNDADLALLRYDAAAMDEPVLTGEDARDRAWQAAEALHPEWAAGRYLAVPDDAWWVSWCGAGSARYAGTVTRFTVAAAY